MNCLWIAALLLIGGKAAADESQAPIKSDEQVLFFPTLATPVAGSDAWDLPIHGWIFEQEWAHGMALRWAAAEGIDAEALTAEQALTLQERVHWFVLDGERGKAISVRIAGRLAAAGVSGADGHFHGTVRLTAREVADAAEQRGAYTVIPYRAVPPPGDDRVFAGHVVHIGSAGVSVVSDIDDTIKVTGVHDRAALIANTFFQPMAAVPGMADYYRGLAGLPQRPDFHYVSASPWQLSVPLQQFLEANAFPPGSVHLRPVALSYAGARAGFAVPNDYKVTRIAALCDAFPKRRFVLIGDGSERDPEAYAELARRYPAQVARILIRATPGNPPDSPRFAEVFAGLRREQWEVFIDPPHAVLP